MDHGNVPYTLSQRLPSSGSNRRLRQSTTQAPIQPTALTHMEPSANHIPKRNPVPRTMATAALLSCSLGSCGHGQNHIIFNTGGLGVSPQGVRSTIGRRRSGRSDRRALEVDDDFAFSKPRNYRDWELDRWTSTISNVLARSATPMPGGTLKKPPVSFLNQLALCFDPISRSLLGMESRKLIGLISGAKTRPFWSNVNRTRGRQGGTHRAQKSVE